MKKINFKQGKYIMPLIIYVLLLVLGYFVIDILNFKASADDTHLKTTDYLSSELPDANLSDIGSKRDNVDRVFGNLRDRSAVNNIEDDTDSLRKKEEYESRYNEEEASIVEQQERERDELERLRELTRKLQAQQQRQSQPDLAEDDDFLSMLTPSERREVSRFRRGMSVPSESLLDADTLSGSEVPVSSGTVDATPNAVKALDSESESSLVVKKSSGTSDRFHTLSDNAPESNLIRAIIDEELKGVNGSRVRLRLLDDIEFGEVSLPKGSYLYCTLSGFGSQRVKGKIESVLVGDNLYKISLSVYDMDGLEGLYVPQSAFREAARDIAGSATQGGSLMSGVGSGTGNNVAQWAGQVLQNAYQQTTNAISKAIRKNRVRLKYGTHVYLLNSQDRKELKRSSSSSGR